MILYVSLFLPKWPLLWQFKNVIYFLETRLYFAQGSRGVNLEYKEGKQAAPTILRCRSKQLEREMHEVGIGCHDLLPTPANPASVSKRKVETSKESHLLGVITCANS